MTRSTNNHRAAIEFQVFKLLFRLKTVILSSIFFGLVIRKPKSTCQYKQSYGFDHFELAHAFEELGHRNPRSLGRGRFFFGDLTRGRASICAITTKSLCPPLCFFQAKHAH